MEQQAIAVLSGPVYRGLGLTLTAESMHKLHQITVSKETLPRWMAGAGWWRAGRRCVVEIHPSRPRPRGCGELVQWETRLGRRLAFCTDKAGMFPVMVQTKRQEQREGRDRPQMPPTQVEGALRALNAMWIPAHSPQVKERVERQFLTARDRLVKGMRVAGVCMIEEANAYLESKGPAWVESDPDRGAGRCCRRPSATVRAVAGTDLQMLPRGQRQR